MKVFQRCYFPSVKAARAPELFERALAAVGPEAAQRAEVVLDDGPSRKTSAVERVC